MADGASVIVFGPAHPSPVEARAVAPDQPGGGSWQHGAYEYAMWQMGLQQQEDRVTPASAMAYSAVWACVRYIAEQVAGLGWHCYERQPDGRTRLPIEDNIAWLLGMQANPESNAYNWRRALLKDCLTWGNGYAEIERDGYGRPAWLWRIHPSRVAPVRDPRDGRLWYEVCPPAGGGEWAYLRPEDVLHFRGLGDDDLVGWSPVEMARRSIRLGLQQERYGSAVFGKSPMPGGIIEMPGNQTAEQRNEYRKGFQAAHSGVGNAGNVVVLSNGVKFTPATLPNDSAQFLESRSFQVVEVCRWYAVPPHKVGDLSRSTFSNVEEQEIQAVGDCLRPWCQMMEAEANVKLYGIVSRGRKYTKLNLDALLRGNTMAQTDSLTKKVAAAILTPNEARDALDQNPDPDGDKLMIQGAMVPLSRAIDPPEPAAPAAPAPSPAPAVPGPCRRVFGALLGEAYGRLLRIDNDKARRTKGKDALLAHVGEWYAEPAASERVAASLLSAFRALALVRGLPPGEAERLAGEAAARHVARCRERLLSDGADALMATQDIVARAVARDLEPLGEEAK